MNSKPYPSEISEEERNFVAPWRFLSHNLSLWQMLYQQFQRWDEACCSETIVSDMRSVIRISEGRRGQALRGHSERCTSMPGRTRRPARSTCKWSICPQQKGFVLLTSLSWGERSCGWLSRFRRLNRDFERFPQVLGFFIKKYSLQKSTLAQQSCATC